MDVHSLSSTRTFETYIESWEGIERDLIVLKEMPIGPNTNISIAFDSFAFSWGNSLPGLQFGHNLEQNEKDLRLIMEEVQSRGGKVKLSFGGATYQIGSYLKSVGPQPLATEVANTIRKYGLNGVDLDIEDFPPGDLALNFLRFLKEDLAGEYIISLTIPGQSWTDLNWVSQSAPFVDVISFMEYNIWIPSGSKVIEQIQVDIDTYITDWKIPKEKIQLGLMPGVDDNGMNLTLEDATYLADFAVEKGLAGVMIWDANRDFGGLDGRSSFAYTIAIQDILSKNRQTVC